MKVGPNSSCCHHFVGRIPGHVGQIPGHVGQIPETQIDDFLKEFDGFQRKSMDSLWNLTVGCVGQIPGHVGQIPGHPAGQVPGSAGQRRRSSSCARRRSSSCARELCRLKEVFWSFVFLFFASFWQIVCLLFASLWSPYDDLAMTICVSFGHYEGIL